jgi:hypothetical protein
MASELSKITDFLVGLKQAKTILPAVVVYLIEYIGIGVFIVWRKSHLI